MNAAAADVAGGFLAGETLIGCHRSIEGIGLSAEALAAHPGGEGDRAGDHRAAGWDGDASAAIAGQTSAMDDTWLRRRWTVRMAVENGIEVQTVMIPAIEDDIYCAVTVEV